MTIKRLIDCCFASAGLVVLSPVLIALALAVRLDSPGPAIFRQTRVGRFGREFQLIKFRSMRTEQPRGGPKVTAAGDPRITRVGRWIRRAKLDELPQLWNVLIGDMSLVGPRPEVPKYVALYSDEQRQVLNVRPGITCRTSLAYINEEELLANASDPAEHYQRVILPAKLDHTLEGLADTSLGEYFRVLTLTIRNTLGWKTDRHEQRCESHASELAEATGLRGFSVEWVATDAALLSKRNCLYRYEQGVIHKEPVATFPAPAWRRVAAQMRLGQRLLRFSYYNVIPLPDGRLFATFDRQVGVQRGEHFIEVAGLERPTRVLRGGCAALDDGRVYFGEYLNNPDRGPIHIYEFNAATNQARVAYTFSAGSIRHVHGVHHDRYTGDLYCVTGDLPDECRLSRTADRFETLQTIGAGDESWRCVALVCTADAVWYATDAQYRQNKVFRIDRADGAREEVADLPGPVYFGRETPDGVMFAVAAERCPSQHDDSASLWRVSESGRVACIASLQKDRWPNRYFQHGIMNFSGGDRDTPLMINTMALRRADNRVFQPRSAA